MLENEEKNKEHELEPKKEKCIACNGTGISSNGFPCSPCGGTGYKGGGKK